MANPARRKATYEDLLAAPEHMVAEIIDGELYTQPRPASRHALASSVLGSELGERFHRGRGGPGGWWILDEPELHRPPDVVVSDIAGWRRETMPEFPDQAYFSLAPDWVCEVLSPSTEKIDRALKLPIYSRARVHHVWLVNPIARILEVLRLGDDAEWRIRAVHEGNAVVRAEPFEAIELELAALWG